MNGVEIELEMDDDEVHETMDGEVEDEDDGAGESSAGIPPVTANVRTPRGITRGEKGNILMSDQPLIIQ